MTIEQPKGSSIYVFGSALCCLNPGDLDILVVYDPIHSSPDEVIRCHQPLVIELQRMFNLKVDSTFLTQTEEHEVEFVATAGAIPFDAYLQQIGKSTKSRKYHDQKAF